MSLGFFTPGLSRLLAERRVDFIRQAAWCLSHQTASSPPPATASVTSQRCHSSSVPASTTSTPAVPPAIQLPNTNTRCRSLLQHPPAAMFSCSHIQASSSRPTLQGFTTPGNNPRSFAAAAKGAAASKAAAAAPPAAGPKKKPQRGETRLYMCRNSRFRHGYEQIWPTLRIPHETTQELQRNSRIFVRDLGKSITLRGKFRLLSSPTTRGAPVPHQQLPAILHESDLHLDAVGEHPRYLKIRRLNRQYATKLENVRKLRLLLGFRRRHYMQKLYESSLMQVGPHRVWKLVCAMESQLNMFALRCGFAPDSLAMMGVLRGRRLALNGCLPRYDAGTVVQPGDMVAPAPNREHFFRAYIAHGMQNVLFPGSRTAPTLGTTVYSSF